MAQALPRSPRPQPATRRTEAVAISSAGGASISCYCQIAFRAAVHAMQPESLREMVQRGFVRTARLPVMNEQGYRIIVSRGLELTGQASGSRAKTRRHA